MPIARRRPKHEAEDRETRNKWIQENPPNADGYWYCYLHISPMCLNQLDIYAVTMEHVIAKGKGIEYRHDLKNIKPACSPCNSLKSSRSLESLSKEFPHLISLLS